MPSHQVGLSRGDHTPPRSLSPCTRTLARARSGDASRSGASVTDRVEL